MAARTPLNVNYQDGKMNRPFEISVLIKVPIRSCELASTNFALLRRNSSSFDIVVTRF